MTFLAAQPPFGTFSEPFPDVFTVSGGFRMGPGIAITRNMTVIRQGGALTLINSVRLGSEGEAALDALGKVEHLVRLGAFHGADDAYYVDRYKPTLWAPPRTKHAPGLETQRELVPGANPIEGATTFAFAQGKHGECAIVLPRDGGILITTDSYQNWTSHDGCSLPAKLFMKAMGFGPTIIGGPWVKAMGPGVRGDFDRLLEQPFTHLVPAHGAVLRDAAKEGLRTAIAKRFR
jgi:hypothetical protein